ncbi:MAG: lysyl oxidase family protein [Byssovorax sp.]
MLVFSLWALGSLAAPGCGGSQSSTSSGTTTGGMESDPGALIKASMDSQVAVVLDEIPPALRDKVAASLIAKDEAFWINRAKKQVVMTKYRLAFRTFYYAEGNRQQLPLPPDSLWEVTIKPDKDGSTKPRRAMVGTHDVVMVDYHFESTLLSTPDSPGITEPELAKVGGVWDEPFIFPVDPELLFQRTGYACMDEVGFPPNSVDSEETAVFYDQECVAQGELSKTACHQTALPKESCVEALESSVGKIETKVHFERLAWDAAAADKARVGDVSNPTGPDIRAGVKSDVFPPPKVIYRYIPEGDCTLAEKCVGAPGWRRLLQFSSVNWNTGKTTLEIGAVDYLISGMGGGDLAKHNIYEYSECHQHYHFMHYGTFTYGDQVNPSSKRGFCLQSTDRLSNNESAPLHNPYADCSFQGIEAGWGDNYNAGIDCQWIDVTEFDVSKGPIDDAIHEHFNPDGFLCEGKPVLDSMGQQEYEPTDFKTAKGEPVDRPKCDFMPDWDKNNTRSEDVELPALGESFVNQPCTRGQIGPLRNCGFKKQADTEACTPGATVNLTCTVPAGASPQTLRICESSKVLGSGTACTHGFSLANGVITEQGVPVIFTCPSPRDANEPGGLYSVYASPLTDDDKAETITCMPINP